MGINSEIFIGHFGSFVAVLNWLCSFRWLIDWLILKPVRINRGLHNQPSYHQKKNIPNESTPRLNATIVPRPAPTMFTVAIGKIQITPLDAKTNGSRIRRSVASSGRKEENHPKNLTKKKTKKLPVPGPKNHHRVRGRKQSHMQKSSFRG